MRCVERGHTFVNCWCESVGHVDDVRVVSSGRKLSASSSSGGVREEGREDGGRAGRWALYS